MSGDLRRLYDNLQYQFKNPALLLQALTHRSARGMHNERLEFLGDSVLNFVITEALYLRNSQYDEGSLTRLRASLVRESTLTQIAGQLELSDFLNMGAGETVSGGHKRRSTLADAVEAVFGAVLLDAGYDTAKRIILGTYGKRLTDLPDPESLKDPKTRLQECLQGQGLPLPVYTQISAQGKPHQQQFTMGCEVSQRGLMTRATGSSRRKAEQEAASLMLEKLSNE